MRVAVQDPPLLKVPSIALPLTRPVYSVRALPATWNVIWSPRSLPATAFTSVPDLRVPEIIWNSCLIASSPCESFHVPAALAGTIQSSAVHHISQPLTSCAIWSGDHSPIVNVLET